MLAQRVEQRGAHVERQPVVLAVDLERQIERDRAQRFAARAL